MPEIADFEAYMPDAFDGRPFGLAGLLATADAAGIGRMVVFPKGIPVDPRANNAALFDATKGEARVLPGFLINPMMGPLAIDDLRRCADRGGRTVKLMTTVHGYRMDAPSVDPVMEVARELKLPVTVHTGSPLAGCSPDQIGSLASRHPDVPIIMDHMGYREWVNSAVTAAQKNANLYLGTSLIAAVEPILIKDIVGSGRLGAGRIVFGSNLPGAIAAHGVNGILGAGFKPEDQAMILAGTFRTIYGGT